MPVIVTVAEPDFVVSACNVAITVTCAGFGTLAGAVYSPVEEIAPFDVPPATLHVTAPLVFPMTLEVNCCVPPVATVAVAGKTLTDIGVGGVELPPPHPPAKQSRTLAKAQKHASRMKASLFL